MNPIDTYKKNQNLRRSTDHLRAKLDAENRFAAGEENKNPIRGAFLAATIGIFLWWLGWKFAEWILR